ncbi:MAG: beta-Ala-His dipeptidase [Bacteroidales bacterium]|nr:beta-Ala-His dipeptidase [Bacteroidales bacterium]
MDTQRVLDIFKEITTVPRGSGDETRITEWLTKWGKSRSLDVKVDGIGNVCITREAAKGKENVPTVVLQAHQDMVCEKNEGVAHDFLKDSIKYVEEDGWLIAKDTTLGADDGIGIAAALALLESDEPTGKIEAVFTISEETGMDGAEYMKDGFFTGRILINLDSEDEGQLFIGCAGGVNTEVRIGFVPEPVCSDLVPVTVTVGGGLGGHSGDDINKERMNAVQQMARFLYAEFDRGFQLIDIDGGGKHNAIARECKAVIAVPSPASLKRRAAKFSAELREEFHNSDPGVFCTCSAAAVRKRAADYVNTLGLLTSLYTCPHGVQAMSQDIPGLVQTSTNLASVHRNGNRFEIVTSQRSSSVAECRNIASRVRANFEAVGASVRHVNEYPGWNPNPDSPILARCVESYRRLFNREPEVKAIHAGLECGLFLKKFPGLDMISFGPTLRCVHAPGEKLELASLPKFVDLLNDVVCNLK